MKTKTHLFAAGILCIGICTGTAALAQQPQKAQPKQLEQNATAPLVTDDNYSYKLYSAPNNRFGYDILKNGKPVYHGFVLMYVTKEGKRFFSTKTQTETAAQLAVGKMNTGKLPELSRDEIKKALAITD